VLAASRYNFPEGELISPCLSAGITTMDEPADLRLLFHQLNNELGIILSYAELLEAKSSSDPSRARAAQVIKSALDAMRTAKEIRLKLKTLVG
jgi:signal transduction histidine kinase